MSAMVTFWRIKSKQTNFGLQRRHLHITVAHDELTQGPSSRQLQFAKLVIVKWSFLDRHLIYRISSSSTNRHFYMSVFILITQMLYIICHIIYTPAVYATIRDRPIMLFFTCCAMLHCSNVPLLYSILYSLYFIMLMYVIQ